MEEEKVHISIENEQESVFDIRACRYGRCLICNSFDTNAYFKSNVTNKVYDKRLFRDADCGNRNVIYLLTCECGLQYVGETSMQLNARTSKHRSVINDNITSTVFSSHIKENNCCFENVNINIIEQIVGDPKNEPIKKKP